MRQTLTYPLLILAVVMLSLTAVADDAAEAWLEADDDSTRLVNEGSLTFLADAQGRRVLQTRNRLTITPESLRTGWVRLYQCQSNLDPVPEVEIVYRYHHIRNLRVISSRGMQGVFVKNNSVQMQQVEERSEVCIKAEVQLLKPDGEGGYTLETGPFHRRFLDGYYPLQLDYRIRWPAGLLEVVSVCPDSQEGFPIRVRPGELMIDTLFEGELTIRSKWRALR